ncbi:MAG: mismatch repair protein MutS2 [Campylobacterota bacterium]|nr:mismatch repair protein MutS2 [Campylobacterota bacterium]
MFDKLDLANHVNSLTSLFAREKEIAVEGDYKIHYAFLSDLAKYDFSSAPKVKNIDVEIIKLSKAGVLKIDSLYEIFKIIKYFIYLKKYAFKEGKIKSWLEEIVAPSEIVTELDKIDNEGKINSSVNPELFSIERTIKEKKKQIQTRLIQIANNQKLATYMVDKQVHVINNEEALLVRGGFNHIIKANIVGRSASGFFYTVPFEINKLKNELEHLLNTQSEMIYAVEKEISLVLSKFILFLKFINRAFDRFDHYQARVFFAKSKDLEFVLPSDSQDIVLKSFIHPALHNPKSISLDFRKSVILITGVNAGGKTMLLKSILSAALMAKYLIPFKCNKEETIVGRFKEIDAIIDDPQNVSNDISTFAGRISAFRELFKKREILVGVDEIELGTDSEEAAALFKVVIEALIEKECKIVITTHHKRLAALLASNKKVELLAAIYDEEKRVPTYGFLQGSIGKSYAFETAIRYGIPLDIVNQAKEVYGIEKERLNDLIERSSQLELELELKKDKINSELEALCNDRKKIAIQKEELKKALEDEKSRLNKEYFDAIKEAKNAIKTMDSKEAHRVLNKANELYKKVQEDKTAQKEDFKIGDSVKYSNTSGVIEKIKDDYAIVNCGGIKMTFLLSKLTKSVEIKKKKTIKLDVDKPQRASVSIELHGLRVEDALNKLDIFINDSILAGFDEVYIFHGVGSGILSRAIREFLKEHPSVKSYESDKNGAATIARF